MEKRLTTFLAALLLSVGAVWAQTQVKGTIISADDGEPLPGASVKVVGEKMGTTTNLDGEFTITVPSADSRLEISHTGMLRRVVRARNGMRIALDTDNRLLDEVMVVAYGTAKKSAFTGSAVQINADEISKVQVTNAADALKGKVAGVQLTNSSGAPGQTSPSIRIRGINSINAGNTPLYVIDGVPVGSNFDMNTLNSQDIESMSVLKDAAASALYGARGANGVILITTKKAKHGQSSITVDAKWGANSKGTPRYKYITDPGAYYEMWYAALNNYAQNRQGMNTVDAYRFANANLTANNSFGLGYNVYTVPEGQNLIGLEGKLNPNATLGALHTYDGQEYTLYPDDWYDEAFKTGLRQEYSMVANGSNGDGSFYASVNYLNNKGIVEASDFERLTSRLRADYNIRPWLKLIGNFGYTHYRADQTNPNEEGSSGSSGNVFAMTTAAPIYPLYIRDGQGNIIQDPQTGIPMYDYGTSATSNNTIWGKDRPYLGGGNPISANQLDKNYYEGNAFNASGIAEVRFLKDFKFTSANSVFLDDSRQTSTSNPFYGQYVANRGSIYKYHTRALSTNFLQQLDWSHSFGDHNVDVMLAHEYYRYKYYYLYGNKSNQFSPDNDEMAGAVIVGSTNSYTSEYNTEGWLGRAQYNYAEKYFVSGSFRRDASSRFHKDHRWGNFWSVGAGWLINKEKFLSNQTWIDELKFKASYGQQGNDNIGNFRYMTYYAIENSNDNVSLVPSALGNKDITWETVGTFNTGIDFSFWKGRLSGSIEYYYKKTSDMLFWFSLPTSYGYSGYYDNIGDMRNTGVEFTLNGDVIRTRDLTWSLYANIATNSNKITYIPDENKVTECDGVKGYVDGSYFIGEGESMYNLRYRKYAGVNEEGLATYWKDITDKDGNVTGEERVTNPSEATYHLIGTAMPKAYGGFGTRFEYKGFDLSLDFNYQLGGKCYDAIYAESMAAQTTNNGHAIHKDMYDAWSATNTSSNIPRWQYNEQYAPNAASDRFIISSNYLSFNNFTVGYTLPSKLTNKIKISKLRFYVVGDNICYWSKRKGMDPRMSISGGTSSAYYSPMRTISGGVSVTF